MRVVIGSDRGKIPRGLDEDTREVEGVGLGDTITNKEFCERKVARRDALMTSAAVRRIALIATPARIIPLLLALAILVFLYYYASHFFAQRNIVNILVQMSSLALLAIGMTFVMVGGGIDLSMPATMAFGAVLGAFLMRAGYNPVLANLVTLLAAAAVGLVNGAAVAVFRMTPFVVTLASMTAVGGATVWMTNSVSVSHFPDAFFNFYLARPFGVPVTVIILVVAALIASTVTSSTIFGRWLYALGINARAARVARIPVERVLFVTYLVSALLAGLTGVLLSARLGSASANIGNDGVVLDIVSACVVGGVSIYGGAGKPLGAVFGAFFITLISNSLNQLGVSYFMNLVVKGIVIIAFIYLDKLARREP
jgi:ribose/xylose/arabinose/galactoside ABC-type transport system permease subunit